MSEIRKTERLLQTYLKHVSAPADAEAGPRVLADALTAMHETKRPAAPPGRMTWRTIMASRAGKLAAAAVVAGVVLFALFDSFTQPAWALADAIEAVKKFPAVHVVGAFPGGTADIWMRADKALARPTDVVVKGSHGAVTWTRDGSTYHYEPSQNTVYFENALTLGLSQFLGPQLLELLSTAPNVQMARGRDPATGRDRVTLFCSVIDVHGAQSWMIEFDAGSKLPIAFKTWQNLDRSGPPAFEAFTITYYEELPDSVFAVSIPGQPAYVRKPLTIPDENIAILSDPADGISAEGLPQQEAAERILRTVFQAVIAGDLTTLRKMSPLFENWNDEFLQAAVLKKGKNDRIVEILGIGQATETGRSKLGPIVALPVSVQRQDGIKAQQKMIVQFRQLGGVSSCVVHGPYGLPREME
jgi:hypothetical protein